MKNKTSKKKENKKRIFPLLILFILIILLNYLSSLIAEWLIIPFYLDTWATSLGVILGNLPIAIAAGTAYNIIKAIVAGNLPECIWALSTIWVALITYILHKKKMITLSNPVKIIGSGIIIGLTNALITILISSFFFGGHTYPGTMSTYNLLLQITKSSQLSIIIEHLITEMTDKTIAIFGAALALEHIPKKIKQFLKQEKEVDKK